MHRTPTKLKAVSRERPCAVCQGTDGCSIGEDGLILCRRLEGLQAGFVCLGKAAGDSQWTMYRREGDPALTNGKPPEKANSQAKPSINFAAKAAKLARNLTPDLAAELATALGLPVAALSELPLLGYCADGPFGAECWTFPEADGAGNIIGLMCRHRDGSKKAWPGGHRGLTMPTRWQERDGSIYLPEGASDTLTLTALGMAAIGRPSNTGGIARIAELMRDVPPDRAVIVLGELDANDKGQWPGRDGAIKATIELSAKMGRPVQWALCPDKAKDVRAWAMARKLPISGEAIGDDWGDAGDKFSSSVKVLSVETVGTELPKSDKPPGYVCELIDSAAFAAGDFRPEWLVKRLLVRNHPGVLGGPKKCLKTSLLVDLAVSLAAGVPFLGEFAVPRPCKVALLSGESGNWTLQETALRICAARGVDFAGLGDKLFWGFRLPQLALGDQLAALRDALAERKIEVMLFDPIYLALLSGQSNLDAANLFQIGPLLMSIGQVCLSVGCTPLLVHHSKKFSSKNLEPLDLDDLAYAGIAEYARQWLLVGRAADYEPGTGLHKLWITAGGSCGHGGLWGLEIDEGKLVDDFTGRKWAVAVNTAGDVRQRDANDKELVKRQKKEAAEQTDAQQVLQTLRVKDPTNQGVSFTSLRKSCALGGDRFERSIIRLLEAGEIVESKGKATAGNSAKINARMIRRVIKDQLPVPVDIEPERQPSAHEVRQQAKEAQRETDKATVIHALEVNDPTNCGMAHGKAREAAGLSPTRFGAAVTALKAVGKIEDVPLADGVKTRTNLLRRCLPAGTPEHPSGTPVQGGPMLSEHQSSAPPLEGGGLMSDVPPNDVE